MKPWETLAEASAPDGGKLVLQRRDTETVLRVNGQVLMTSRIRDSELALAEVATTDIRARDVTSPRVLVGGLGLAFTLRALLDALPETASIIVAEVSPAIVEWNRTLLRELSGDALADPRVTVEIADVAAVIARHRDAYDAILLDVDNGPSALTRSGNRALYGPIGLSRARQALADNGLYVVWSAGADDAFVRRMKDAGFDVQTRIRTSGGAKHVLFIGRRRAAASRAAAPRDRRGGARR